jgi:hypothetical protein
MGAPVGNQNAAKAKQWAAAIERALEARGAGDRLAALNALAAKLLDKCEEGDMSALKELGDRLDGKPAQALVGGGEGDAPIQTAVRVLFGRD